MIKDKYPWIASLERSQNQTIAEQPYTPFAFAQAVSNARLEEALARTAELETQATELSIALSDQRAATEDTHSPKSVWPMRQINNPAFVTNL
jgi:hypothetical protein